MHKEIIAIIVCVVLLIGVLVCLSTKENNEMIYVPIFVPKENGNRFRFPIFFFPLLFQ